MSISSKLLLASVLPAFAVSAMAQVTTSSVSGRVADKNGSALEGAIVSAVHNPSGTRYTGVANQDGRFTIQGMRTGGPYTITISLIGHEKKIFSGLVLQLGQQLPLDVQLQDADSQLGEVVVQTSSKRRAGAIENFSLESITQTATVDRHIYDIIRNAPMVQTNKAGGLSIAGQNNRYNSFMIDGSVSNDVFGLAASGTNGGQSSANPISLDAIQEIQVSVAPFDVRQSGFTGGAINAVTKQGTNAFKGSVYGLYNNESMYGKYNQSAHDGIQYKPLSEQSSATIGATLGGPIVKDKLFFFLSAEQRKESYPSTYYPGYAPDALSQETADKILSLYKQRTGKNDSYGSRDVEQKAVGILARLDWNINDWHKLAVRWQHNDSFDEVYSASSRTFNFNNSGYSMNNVTNSFVLELNSKITDRIHNELRASAAYVRDHRDVAYQGPTVQINDVPTSDKKRKTSVNIGTEYSSGVNYLHQDIYTLEDNLSFYLGDHTVTLGTHNEFYRMKNAFIQAANGAWYYNNFEDFVADKPWRMRYYYSDPALTGGDLKYAPLMNFAQWGLYGQDKWNVNSRLELTAGLRFDLPMSLNEPMSNPTYNKFAQEKHFPLVGEMPSPKLMVSPRLGFRYWTDAARHSLLRGGVGIFTGRVPFVWLSNAYGNTGMELKKITISNKDVPNLETAANDPYAAVKSAKAPAAEIVVIDKQFRYPQALRFNLAWEYTLPANVKMTLEGLYSRNLNAVFYENLAVEPTGKAYAIAGNEASAVKYYSKITKEYQNIINLRSVNKGYSYSLSALFEKDFDFGLGLRGSYTYGRSKSVNDGTSSVAASNWGYYVARDMQDAGEVSNSRFDIPHRVMFQVNYTSPRYARGLMSTELGLTYNGSSGYRYSLVMNESADFNGDGQRGNSLLYIPTAAEVQNLVFTDHKGKALTPEALATARQNVENWIMGDSYAANHRGQIAERNSNLSKWENEINVHLAQNFHLPKQWGKLQVSLDVMNFANMLNKEWGATYGNVYSIAPLGVAKMNTKDGVSTAQFFDNTANATIRPNDVLSRWHMQLGVRYTF
ncbi:MAG: TonB-dependent receptor [Bacteroidales bacterium]|nr:TonB-dependent receptor [Bacteroidales bacterium]